VKKKAEKNAKERKRRKNQNLKDMEFAGKKTRHLELGNRRW